MTESRQQLSVVEPQQHKAKSVRSKRKFLNEKDELDNQPQLRNAQRHKPKQIHEPIRFYQQQHTIMYVDEYVPGTSAIPDQIREIDRKIQQYKKQMDKEVREQMQKQQQEQLRLQQQHDNLDQDRKKSYDFLTNPQIQTITNNEESIQPLAKQPEQVPTPPLPTEEITSSYGVSAKRREQLYDNFAQRVYDRRLNPLLYSKLKKKTPRLNITSKNKVSKGGSGRIDPEEHKLRIFNRENVPCIPDLIVPTFPVKKDYMAQNILAYLKEYTPLFRGAKNFEYPKCVKNILQEEIDAIQKT